MFVQQICKKAICLLAKIFQTTPKVFFFLVGLVKMMNSIHNDDKFEVPDGAELLSTQVAGHRFGKCRNKFGLLKHTQSGDILKPVYDERGIREQKFYESVFDHSKDHDVCIVKFRLLIPQYNGLFNDTRMNNKYIRLQSATANMRNPSLLDVKIGAKTYDPHATEEKRKSEKNKYRYALEIGFRILGMKVFPRQPNAQVNDSLFFQVYDRTTKTYIEKDKEYGLTVTPQNASEGIVDKY